MKNKLIKSLLTSSILMSSLFVANPVSANNYDAQIEEAQQQAQNSEREAAGLNQILSQLTNDMANTQAALDQLNAEIAQNETSINTTLDNLQISQEEMNVLLEEIAILEKNIQERSEKLENQARIIQVDGNPTNYVEFVLNAESLTDVIARIDVVGSIVKTSNRMIEAQKRDQEAVEVKRVETERKINQQHALMEELETIAANLEVQKVSQSALIAQINIEKNSVASERSALIAQRNEALQLVNSLERDREEARIAAERAARERAEREEQERLAQERAAQQERDRAEAERIERQEAAREQEREVAVAPASSDRESTNNQNNSNDESNAESNTRPEPTPPVVKEEKKENNSKNNSGFAPSGSVLSIAGQYTHINKYTWGGNTPETGFDCSGFTKYVFAKAGKTIPRNSRAQYSSSTKVSNPQPGDLVFFSGNRNGVITHVGIYVGGGRFIGSQTSTGVAYASATTGYWGSRLVGYGRY